MKIIYRTILLTFLLSGMAGTGYAALAYPGAKSSGIDSVAGIQQQALYSILNLHFDEADSLLNHYAEQYSIDPEIPYLENYLDFLNTLINGDPESFENYQLSSGKRIESIKDVKKVHPGSLSALSTIHLQSSVLCAYHNEMFRAAKHLYYSNRYLRQEEESEVVNSRKFRNRGILILFSASVPEEYHWLMKVFGLRGGVKEGMGYLEEYYSFAKGAERLEAYLILVFAGQTLAPDNYEPVSSWFTGTDEFGAQARTLKMYSGALSDLSSGKSHAVIDNLGDFKQDAAEKEFPYIDLILGEALLNTLDPKADIHMKRFALKNQSIHYRHYAWHKLSWSYFLKDELELFEESRQKVMDAGEPYLDADRQAMSEASDTLPLNKKLLKARLLFDGGQYSRALGILEDSSGISLPNKRDSLEFQYRKARILDQMGEIVSSLEIYGRVIEEGSDEDWYYAPNSALCMGMIYEKAGDHDKALRSYKECLKINDSAYKKSIDYKARQGIRRLDN